MNQVLMVLVIGGLLLLLALLILSTLTTLASPAGPRSVLKGLMARVVCPETGTPTRVRLGIPAGGQGSVPEVLSCERFPMGVVTCDRRCLEPDEEISPPMALATPA